MNHSPDKPQVLLMGQTSVPWDEYKTIEQELLDIAKMNELTFPQKLMAIYHRGQEAGKARINSRTQLPFEESLNFAKSQGAAAEGLKAKLIRGLFLAFMGETVLKGEDQAKSSFVSGFLMQTLRLAFGWGSFQVKTWGDAVSTREVDPVPLSYADQSISEPLERYLRALISQGQILTQQGLFRGVCTVLVAFSLIQWFSRFAAKLEKKDHVSTNHVEKAIELVEKFFVQHNKGFQEFISTGVFSILFEALMVRPLVATSLVLI